MDIRDWDQCYVQGNTPWNRGEPAPPLVEWLARHQPLHGKALVPGCGVGHDVALLADAGLEVTGLDIAPTAIQLARERHPQQAACFVQGDLFALPPPWHGAFDFVIEHTCLSALPPDLRPAYRDAVRQALRPEGRLVGVWYIDPDLDPGETGPPFPLPLTDLDTLFRDGFDIVEDYVPAVAYPGRLGRERLRVLRRRA